MYILLIIAENQLSCKLIADCLANSDAVVDWMDIDFSLIWKNTHSFCK